jgi:hypothetical protein
MDVRPKIEAPTNATTKAGTPVTIGHAMSESKTSFVRVGSAQWARTGPRAAAPNAPSATPNATDDATFKRSDRLRSVMKWMTNTPRLRSHAAKRHVFTPTDDDACPASAAVPVPTRT